MNNRLPEVIAEMRRAIVAGDLSRCLQLQAQIEEQWDAITEALTMLQAASERLGTRMDDLKRGVW